MRHIRLGTALSILLSAGLAVAGDKVANGWIALFDGQTMTGWKANENADSWKVEDGALVCHGPRAHLFYVGEHQPFVNFEFKADVMTTPGSNSGIYFHTKWQDQGWPSAGYEVQVDNSHKDPKRTASLYNVVNVLKAPAKDNEWFTEEIVVRGKRIITKVDGRVLVDYTEPKGVTSTRRLGSGTFALQAHDPNSKVFFKNIMVRPLP